MTGIRGLCNGLGPALFGFVFYLFNVDLNDPDGERTVVKAEDNASQQIMDGMKLEVTNLDGQIRALIGPD